MVPRRLGDCATAMARESAKLFQDFSEQVEYLKVSVAAAASSSCQREGLQEAVVNRFVEVLGAQCLDGKAAHSLFQLIAEAPFNEDQRSQVELNRCAL